MGARSAIEAGIATKRIVKTVHEFNPRTGQVTRKNGGSEFRHLTNIPLETVTLPAENVEIAAKPAILQPAPSSESPF